MHERTAAEAKHLNDFAHDWASSLHEHDPSLVAGIPRRCGMSRPEEEKACRGARFTVENIPSVVPVEDGLQCASKFPDFFEEHGSILDRPC